MKSLQDAIYNWLTIKVVIDDRPEDTAAVETEKMFYAILINDYGIANIDITVEEEMYYVHFEYNGIKDSKRFPKEFIEVMLNQINQEPEKFINYPVE